MEVKSDALDTGARFYTLNDASLALLSVFSSLKTFLSNLPLHQLIRLAWIIGGYILLRPYIELGLRKLFAGQEEHTSDKVRATGIPPPQKFSASGMNNEAAVGRTAWGAAARKRKVMIRQAWEEEQARLAEEHDLDGIDPDLLED